MYNDYGQSSGGGFFSTIIFLAIIAGIVYLLVKKLLPWVNQKLGKDYKWYHIPIAIIGGILALFVGSALYQSNVSKKAGDELSKFRQLSDDELMRIIDSGNDYGQRRSAEIIMEERIARRKRMMNK
ncbi:hypothetical protein CF160_11300 [Enterococcus pseudoavium]|nr:hypothetical protein CF160_11300 [Enterococcus pseudoavium]